MKTIIKLPTKYGRFNFTQEFDWSRKPCDIETDVNYLITWNQLNGREKNLPIIEDNGNKIVNKEGEINFDTSEFINSDKYQYYILKTNGFGDFLVDNQGYDYPRYMVRIENY